MPSPTIASAHSSGRIPYFPALDGLRGIALLVMLVYHGKFSWIGGGYLSVSTFFTLSGFLITSLLLFEREASGRVDLRDFWARRLRRLMPAALAGLALTALYAVVAATPSQLIRLPWDATAALLYFANFRFMTSGHSYWEIFSRPSPLQHYWSLSIEEQFYVAYPLLLIAVGALARRPRATLRVVLLLLASASTLAMVGLSWSGAAPARLYYGTDTRASEFLVGALLATLLVRGSEIRPWSGRGHRATTFAASAYVVAVVILVEQDSAFLYRGGFALYSIATAVLINAALQPGIVRTLLSWRPLVWAGVVSYGTYIYHWPIYLALDAPGSGLSGAALLAVQMGATLALAQLSYVFLERPIRSRRWPRGVSAVTVPAAAVAAIVIALLLATGRPGAVDAHTKMRGPWRPTPMPDLASAPASAPRVMVLGDSIGWTLGRGFLGWARRNPGQATVWNLAVYGCGVARGALAVDGLQGERNCDDWPDRWEADIERFRPDVVIILSGLWDLAERRIPSSERIVRPQEPAFDDWLVSEYQLAVDIASSRGARVVWLTSPCVGPEAEQAPLAKTGAFEPHHIDHLNGVILPRLVESRPRQVILFDLFAMLCPAGKFVDQLPWSRDLRPDDIHLGPLSARHVANEIIEATWPALGLASSPQSVTSLAPAAGRAPPARALTSVRN